jgi:tetratricopeptide (TPR) repeat protein
MKIEDKLNTALAHNKHGDYASAEAMAYEVISETSENNKFDYKIYHLSALNILSESLWRRGTCQEALAIAERALALSKNNTGPRIKNLKAIALNNLGNIYEQLAEYMKALDYYEKALVIAEELTDQRGIGAYCSNIGNIYSQLPEYTKALEYHAKAYALYDEIGDKQGLAISNFNIGIVYALIADFTKALEHFEKALPLYQEVGNKQGVAHFTENIGKVYGELSQYAKALQYFEEALALYEKLDDKRSIGRTIGNIGVAYGFLSEYTKAITYFMKALKLSEVYGNRNDFSFALEGLAKTLRNLGRNQEAMEYYQRALLIRREELKTNIGVSDILISIGGLLSEEKQFDEAVKILEEALALAEKLGEKQFASNAHKELASTLTKVGDYLNAYEHITLSHQMEKEVLNEVTRKEVEQFTIRQAIAEKEKEKEIEKMKREQTINELSNTTLKLVQQTDMLLTLRKDLDSIVRKADTAEKAVRSIREKLKEIPEHLLNWEKFSEDFLKVHPDFEKNITQKFPELSKAEIKVCCLLRIGMSTREIGTLLFLSERTVEFHRLNIRKKMAISKKEDMHSVLTAV